MSNLTHLSTQTPNQVLENALNNQGWSVIQVRSKINNPSSCFIGGRQMCVGRYQDLLLMYPKSEYEWLEGQDACRFFYISPEHAQNVKYKRDYYQTIADNLFTNNT